MTKKKILVLTDTMPWGHRSIAKAIFGYLKSNEKTENLMVFYAEVKAETGIATDAYTFLYRYLPSSNRVFHKLATMKASVELMEDLGKKSLPKLEKEIRKIKPDIVISCYFLHSWALVRWKEKKKMGFKLWTVVADPWSINPVSFVKSADKNIVYDEVGKRMAMKRGVKEENILVTGWWTRKEMYQKYDRQEARRKLGIYDDRPVIFVGGGSLGTGSLTNLLPNLIFIKSKVALVINTGVDKLAYQLVERYIKFLNKFKKNNVVYIKNMGWIDNMAEALAACDIVFGKAGPNFLFDSVACQKPFVAITHVGGQEDGNIELIKKKKLGWVREKVGQLSTFLTQYLDEPGYFENKFKETIKEEARNNQESLEKILEEIKK